MDLSNLRNFIWASEKLKEYGEFDFLTILQKISADSTKTNKVFKKLSPVLDRLKLVELLYNHDTYGPYIDAGFDNETSLRIYLTLTCYDYLGQKESQHIAFNDWLNTKKQKHNPHKRDLELDRLLVDGITSKESLINAINTVQASYYSEYGMGNNFEDFFVNILNKNSQNKLLSNFWIKKNPHPPNKGYPAMEFITGQPLEWRSKEDLTKLKILSKTIAKICRNSFTHSLIRVKDDQDKVRVTDKELKYYKLLHTSSYKIVFDIREFGTLNNPDILNIDSLNYLEKDGVVLVYPTDPDIKVDSTIHFFLETTKRRMRCSLGGVQLVDSGRKQLLCYTDGSLTGLLIEFAWRGIYHFCTNELDANTQEL